MTFWLRLILMSLPLWSAQTAAVSGDFISQSTIQKLESTFQRAQNIRLKNKDLLTQTQWRCSLYGVRSQMQVEKDLRLYAFTKTAKDTFKNDGSQVIREYSFSNTDLQGQSGDLLEKLRMTSKGELIGQLLFGYSNTSRIIAYSLCTAG